MWDLVSCSQNIAALDERGFSVTYGDIRICSSQLALVVPPRSVVFSVCSNTLGSLVGYVGFIENGVIPLLLSSAIDGNMLGKLLRIYQPGFLWIPQRLKDKFQYGVVFESFDYCLLRTNYRSYSVYDKLALLLPTSGSTGSPKVVRISYENISANMEAISDYLEIAANDRPITTLPMNYAYGLSVVNSHLCKGATILLTDKSVVQGEFWQQFRDNGATSFSGVPYTYEILSKLGFFRKALPSLRTITQAGGRLPLALHQAFAEYAQRSGIHFFVMYGQTEATARMSYVPFSNALAKCGSVGIAIPGGRFELIDENGSPILENKIIGELVYYGKNVSLGYAKSKDDLARGDENNARLITGDLAKRDKDSYYYIIGRKSRFLKIFGNRVSLDDIEEMVKEAYPEIDCACAGSDDRMVVYVDHAVKCDLIKKYLSSATGLNPVAFDVRFVNVIPKNEAGKRLYSRLGDDAKNED